MNNALKSWLRAPQAALLAGLLMVPSAAGAAASQAHPLSSLEQEVRHELVMLPWFGVFDNMNFRVDGRTVYLMGAVTRPVLAKDAENVVKRIEGVEQVVNNIKVLPLSPFDDDIRVRTLNSIYGYPALQRYGLGVQAPIRIIVENGHVKLEGVVANQMDKNLAGIRANSVPGVFSVENNLLVDRS